MKKSDNVSVSYVAALSIVFGDKLTKAIMARLKGITPNSERVTCGDIVDETASVEDDASVRRVCLDKCLSQFPKLSVRKGRDGGIVHADEVKQTKAAPATAGKAVSAAIAALEAAGIKLSAIDRARAIAAAKASRANGNQAQ